MYFIDENSKTPIYLQICDHFIKEIGAGKYLSGSKLPSIRALTAELGVSKSTVETAYSQLISEGYAESIPGSGYVVQNSGIVVAAKQMKKNKCAKPAGKIYDFGGGDLSDESVPLSLWRKLAMQALAEGNIEKINSYSDKQGEYELRLEIAKYIYLLRGLECPPERIVVTSGLQSALEVIAKLAFRAPPSMAMEEPGFDSVRRVFINNRYSIIPVPVDDEGIKVDKLHETNACLVFTTPSHQMPTGAVMSLERRRQILKWADANDSYIIEDDYDCEFRYGIKPVKSLHSIDRNGRVIYVGTFSKSFSPGLRMSYIVLPERLLNKYHEMYVGYFCAIPWLEQKIMNIYMSENLWVKRVNKLLAEHKKKHHVLLNAIRNTMGSRVTVRGEGGGTHVMLEVRGVAQGELISRARDNNVNISPAEQFWYDKKNYNNSVIIGFNAINEADIEKGVKLLNKAWFSQTKS